MSPQLPKKPIQFVLHFIGSFKWPLIAMIIFEAAQAGCQILLPYITKEIIDIANRLHQSTPEEIFSQLKTPIWSFIGLSFGILIFSRLSGTILVFIGPSLRRMTRYKLYNYLQYHSHRFFTSNFSGSLANRINEISVGVNHSLWTVMFDFWPVFITFSVSMFLLTQVHTELALFLGTWIFFYVIASFLLASKARKYAKAFAAARSKVSGKIVDAVTNILNTKMFARRQFEQEFLKSQLDFEVKKARETFWFMEKMRWFQFIAALILQIGMMYKAVNMWIDGHITVGAFAMVTSLSLLIINDARGLSRRFLEFFEYLGNITDGVSIIVQDHEVIDHPQATNLSIKNAEIEFHKINFQYPEGKEVFKNLNVKINSGEKVGLVGFSGSGKTTFVNLLTRLYDLKEGSITIDGKDIRMVTQDSLRSNIAMIPQDPMLFHRSLMDNIRYGDINATDEEVIQAAKLAYSDDFINELPKGYDSLVGERGIKLSGGQRQRIAIARALLKNAPILILDEATSSLDSKTEKMIQSGLNNLMTGKTVIVIAHRLSTISHMDRILVFDQGEIVEQGDHEHLLKKGGYYSLLWKMQAGGFLPEVPDDSFKNSRTNSSANP